MNLVGWFFLAALVVVGGLVAYWGDQVGRHYGKKRLTYKRLRPRHTAAIITGLFGAFATALAIGALFALSEPVRVWIVEGNAARDRLAKVEAALAAAERELASRGAELAETKGSLEAERATLQRQRELVAESQGQVRVLSSRAEALRSRTLELNSNLRRTSATLRSVAANLGRVREEYARLQREFKATKVNNATYSKLNEQINLRNLELDQELRAAEIELTRLRTTAEELRGSIAQLTQDLDRTTIETRAERERLNRERDEAQRALNLAVLELETAQAQVRRLQEIRDSATAASRTRPMSFERGDELARIAVGPTLSFAEARSVMLALVERASLRARGRGAGAGEGGDFAGFVEIQDRKGNPIPAAMQFDEFVERLAGKREPQVVLAAALLNAFRGEFVPLAVTVRPNPVVFRRGETIVEGRIDSRKTEDEILREIAETVREQLVPKAIREGMIPVAGSPEPLGSIPQDELLALVKQIKASGIVARVMFVAADDTRAADRLKLQFRLR